MTLHVMTYNILDGGEKREAYILDVLRAAAPDIVILQEVFTEDFLKFLCESLEMKYYMGARNRGRKVALLSKLPVLAFKSYPPRFPMWRNFVDAEIEYEPHKIVRVIGVHPIANLGVIFEFWRRWELKHILNQIQDSHNIPCLIAGDFNAIAPGDEIKTEGMPNWLRWIIRLQGNRVYHFSLKTILSAGFIDCFRSLHSDEGFTLPPPNPNARLDYIFANVPLKMCLKKCWVVRTPDRVNLASDHYPVMAEFDFTIFAYH